jgi:hypothetical protein
MNTLSVHPWDVHGAKRAASSAAGRTVGAASQRSPALRLWLMCSWVRDQAGASKRPPAANIHMMLPIAHAGHTLTTIAYFVPVVAFLVWLLATQIRERRRTRG